MDFTFGFAIIAYYTWWILLLVALLIVIYKLITQQNFQVSLRVGINSTAAADEPEQYTFQPLIVKKRNKKQLNKEQEEADENTQVQ